MMGSLFVKHCRIVKHLSDDLAARPGVVAALDFDGRGYAILIQEEMVERPPPGSALLAGDSRLARDQQPATWDDWVNLIPGQDVGVVGEEALENLFGLVGLLVQFD
jgi:hypothetical protein